MTIHKCVIIVIRGFVLTMMTNKIASCLAMTAPEERIVYFDVGRKNCGCDCKTVTDH